MLASSIPLRFTLPWAKNAAGPFIRTVPVTSQIGIQDGAASFNDGFVPDNFTPLAGGGVPPFGQDMNGALNITTTWDQWYQAGAPIGFDATFSTAVGGYPKGAIVDSLIVPGAQWYSTVDGNVTNPDDPLTSANWARVGAPAGTPLPMFSTSPPPGYIYAQTQTIGSAASGAAFADASALFLYVHNWTWFSNAQCPIFTSGGVVTTRGANAVADFNANKRLSTPDARGLSLVAADANASSYLAGVPVVSGNNTTAGSILGENLHALIIAELAAHLHASNLIDLGHTHPYLIAPDSGSRVSGTGNLFLPSPQASAATTGSNNSTPMSINNVSTGSGTAHNTVQRGMVVYWGQKL